MKIMTKTIVIFVALIGLMLLVFRNELFVASPTTSSAPVVTASFERLAKLPSEVNESSGLAILTAGQYITHNDAGNRPYLYKLDDSGKLLQTIKLKLPNVDWEDLAQDDAGNVYIADTGNNENDREELAIYKVDPEQPEDVQAIRFTYEDQTKYPPKKKDRNFDSEALFWSEGNLYIVSKDRGRGETAKVYQLPDQAGTHKAKLIGQHKLKAQVTGATISPDQSTVVLLSEGALHLFTDFDSPAKFYEGVYERQSLKEAGQTEGVAFESEDVLIITSEGGNLYRYTL